MYKYLFGPVPSRRLGISLGVDLIPKKVCSLDCVYCEVGKTTKLTLERKEYVLYDKVIAELQNFMKDDPDLDYITFSGSGEPTLNSRFGDVLQFIKQNYPKIKIAILTNGTLLHNKNVRDELMQADVILPSLDAVSKDVFDKIDRPNSEINIDNYINGIVSLKQEFKGKIWLEILILKGYNDSRTELLKLKEAIVKINPDSVQLNTLDRPGTVDGLQALSHKELQEIVDLWQLSNVEIIASPPKREKVKSYRKDTETAILETIVRRPCTLDDLHNILGIHVNEINKYLGVLEDKKMIKKEVQERGVFYLVN